MEQSLKYALGYYDAVVTHLKEENETPISKESVCKFIKEIMDESTLFEESIVEIGINALAEKILKGEDYE